MSDPVQAAYADAAAIAEAMLKSPRYPEWQYSTALDDVRRAILARAALASYDAKREAALKELADLGQAWDAAPPAVRVKPLDWVYDKAETDLGTYIVDSGWKDFRGGVRWFAWYRSTGNEQDDPFYAWQNGNRCETEEAAKAAAQADYEARILAALAPAASPAPWSPPPEADREEGYRCLGWVNGQWETIVWKEYWRDSGIGGHCERDWTLAIGQGFNIAAPTAFAPLPSTPAREGEP